MRGTQHEGFCQRGLRSAAVFARATCPDVFSIGDDGVAHAIEGDVPEDAEDGAQEAADNCPVSAITVE